MDIMIVSASVCLLLSQANGQQVAMIFMNGKLLFSFLSLTYSNISLGSWVLV